MHFKVETEEIRILNRKGDLFETKRRKADFDGES